MGRKPLYFFLGLLLLSAAGLCAQTSASDPVWLEGVFWVELDPVIKENSEYPLSKEAAALRALEEASAVFSGMIYGYRFSYTPSDKTRGVAEIFTLDSLYLIPWGDEALSSRQTLLNGDLVNFRIRYTLKDYQILRIHAWNSNIIPVSAGTGESPVWEGYLKKIEAVKEAIKGAVRSYAREKVPNKPKEVSGEVLLTDIPYIIIDSGNYKARVRIKLRDLKVVPYGVY